MEANYTLGIQLVWSGITSTSRSPSALLLLLLLLLLSLLLRLLRLLRRKA